MLASEVKSFPEAETVTISGLAVKLYGRKAGIPVILSPGLGGHGAYWSPQVEALCEKFRVILYDHRGTGGSERDELSATYHARHMADDIALILEGLDYEAAHIVGHAAGAVAGLQLALDHPNKVLSLTCVNGWAVAEPHFKRCFEIRTAIYKSGGAEAYLKAQPLFLFPAEWINDHLEELDAQAAHHAPGFQSEANLLARIGALRDFDIRDRLEDITCSVMVIGTLDDMLVPVRSSAFLAEGLPNAQCKVIGWGGHAVNVTVPDEFNDILTTFLKGI
ncbi:pyrimidine utilization protein D [Asticcacaulis sp. BYS171W]|uniref:Putative carbamate hydrolase RutD n=1 Tax=Asticcacaulis aquaticus TaxID=2984212 RepID=A0ABT5HTR8_9CAUL|nr:pyrimidine utilization protein D [Asticcacaulis aquaticus]MDC7683379.1 pyrimidine utilization protein D [Asticcacaulis aquaticus]